MTNSPTAAIALSELHITLAATPRQSSASPDGDLAALQCVHPVGGVWPGAARAALPSDTCFNGTNIPPPRFCYGDVCDAAAGEQLHTGNLCNRNSNEKGFIAPIQPLPGLYRMTFLTPPGCPLVRQHSYHGTVVSLKSCDARWCMHCYRPESRRIPWSRKSSSTGHPRLAEDILKQAGARERFSNSTVMKLGSGNKKSQDKLLLCPPISFLG